MIPAIISEPRNASIPPAVLVATPSTFFENDVSWGRDDSINSGRFSDKGLEWLCHLDHLKTLAMPNTHGFTDAGLKHIANLTQMESLHLRGELFTRVGLEEIANLKYLKTIKFLEPSSDARAFSTQFNVNR